MSERMRIAMFKLGDIPVDLLMETYPDNPEAYSLFLRYPEDDEHNNTGELKEEFFQFMDGIFQIDEDEEEWDGAFATIGVLRAVPIPAKDIVHTLPDGRAPQTPAEVEAHRMVAKSEAEEPIEMRLCTTEFLVLKPGVLYRFTVDETCDRCKELRRIGTNTSPEELTKIGTE